MNKIALAVIALVFAQGSVTALEAPQGQLRVAPSKAKTALDVYGAMVPGLGAGDFSDRFAVVQQLPADAAMGDNVTAVAGYVWNESGRFGRPTNVGNGVALFGSAVAAASQTAVWGFNTLLTDGPTRAVNSLAGIYLVNEADFNVMSPHTHVLGHSVGGNGMSQPAVALGFIANSLGHLADGSPIRWNTGFSTMAGSATVAFASAPLNETSNSPSQPIWFINTDAANANVISSIGSGEGFLVASSPKGFKVTDGDILVDERHSLIVNGVAVVGARQTGFSPATGTALKSGFDADYLPKSSSTPTQAEFNAMAAALQETRRELKGLRDAMAAHGLIGP